MRLSLADAAGALRIRASAHSDAVKSALIRIRSVPSHLAHSYVQSPRSSSVRSAPGRGPIEPPPGTQGCQLGSDRLGRSRGAIRVVGDGCWRGPRRLRARHDVDDVAPAGPAPLDRHVLWTSRITASTSVDTSSPPPWTSNPATTTVGRDRVMVYLLPLPDASRVDLGPPASRAALESVRGGAADRGAA